MVEQELRFKVVVVGATRVGKTSLIESYMGKKFNASRKPTDQAKLSPLKVELQAIKQGVVLNLMDLPGRDTFVILNRMYLRDANCAIIVYDVNDPASLEAAEVWVQEI